MRGRLLKGTALLLCLCLAGGCADGFGPFSQSKKLKLDEENTSATVDGVTIDLGLFNIEGEETVTVSKVETVSAGGLEEGVEVVAYDFRVEGRSDFETPLTIEIPYTGSPETVEAGYFDEALGEWVPVMYELDAARGVVVITTDHLSTFGVFDVTRSGKRSAFVSGINPSKAQQAYEQRYNDILLGVFENPDGPQPDALSLGLEQFMPAAQSMETLRNAIIERPGLSELDSIFSHLGVALASYNVISAAVRGEEMAKPVLYAAKTGVSWTAEYLGGSMVSFAMLAVLAVEVPLMLFMDTALADRQKIYEDAYRAYMVDYDKELMKEYGTNSITKVWYKKLTAIRKSGGTAEELKQALQGEIDTYAERFWKDDLVVADYQKRVMGDTVGDTLGGINDKLRQQISDRARYDLLNNDNGGQLRVIFQQMEKDIRYEAWEEFDRRLREAQAALNKVVSIKIMEDVPAGQTSLYAGHTVKFAPLDPEADEANWTGTLKGNGAISTKVTKIGYIKAGMPDTVEIYAPGGAEPVLRIPFVFDDPETVVVLQSAPSLAEIVGDYLDGILTVTGVHIDEALRAQVEANRLELENSELAGCDPASLLLMLESMVGEAQERPFSIAQTGETTANLVLGEELIALTYEGGSLRANQPIEGGTITGSFQCSYSEDGSRVLLDGSFEIVGGDEDYPDAVRIAFTLAGSKALGDSASASASTGEGIGA